MPGASIAGMLSASRPPGRGHRATRRHREESRAMSSTRWVVIAVALVAVTLGAPAVQGQPAPSGEYKIGVL